MEEAFNICDELGPLKIIHIHEPTIELKAVLVVDNVALGPSIGGVRMAPDVSIEECARLARTMTLKNAAAGLPYGGGKAVIYGDPKMSTKKKEKLLRAMACALEEVEQYIFAPDMGTDETCMAWVKDEIGRVVGLPRELGGIPLDQIGATGWGLSHVTDVAAEHSDMPLQGARLVVQGFGAVGKHAAHFLCQKGAVLIATTDSKGTIYNKDGLDVKELFRLKKAGKSVTDYHDGKKLKSDKVIDIECDIWIPAARPDVIHKDNVHRLNTKLFIEGANIPITYEAEKYLHKKGILCVPDFIANAGGVICAAKEYEGASQRAAFEAIEEKVRANTAQVLETAKAKKIMPRDAATQIAMQRLKKAMGFRRWGIF